MRLTLESSGEVFLGRLSAIECGRAKVEVLSLLEEGGRLLEDGNISLCVAAVRPKSLEMSIEKCTEMGISDLCIFCAENSSLPIEVYRKRRERFLQIIRSAQKQSGNPRAPKLRLYASLKELLLEEHGGGDRSDTQRHSDARILPLAARERNAMALETTSIADISYSAAKRAHVVVGPEGGFHKDELELLLGRYGYIPTVLSNYTLKTETAAIAACAALGCLCLHNFAP